MHSTSTLPLASQALSLAAVLAVISACKPRTERPASFRRHRRGDGTSTRSGNTHWQAYYQLLVVVLEGGRELRDGLDHQSIMLMMEVARQVHRDGGSEVWLYPGNLWPPQRLSVAVFSGRTPSEHERMIARGYRYYCSGCCSASPLALSAWGNPLKPHHPRCYNILVQTSILGKLGYRPQKTSRSIPFRFAIYHTQWLPPRHLSFVNSTRTAAVAAAIAGT